MKQIRFQSFSGLILLLLVLFFNKGYTQEKNPPSKFFPANELMPVGAYYYPEHWPEKHWERDIKRIAELGFEFTHFAEFSWAKLEPEEGNYNFEWLDKCVKLAHKYGLKVIMCTPSPTPPAWLTNKHPEILLESEEGIKQSHGGRLHANFNNPVYQDYIKEIVTRMAKRYGDDDRIWGWQISNEPHYGTIYDYSDTSEGQFRQWLKNKYKTIDSLNKAWGTTFWSQTYNDFHQIEIPNKKEGGTNPHALLDFQRFTGNQIADGLDFQANILEKYISDDQWVTTNYAYYKFLPPVNPFLAEDDLDFASHTMYMTSQYLNDAGGPLAHRLGSGMELSFSQELAESVNGYTGIMELQPGQINWGAFNPQPMPGAVRMWIWHSFGLGDEFICTYRFRQPLFGSEQTHKGVMEPDGTTLARGGKEYVETIKEIKSLEVDENAEMPASLKSRKTAYLWKLANLLNLENHKHHKDWDSWQFYYTYYENLKTMGVPVTFIQQNEKFDPDKYPFMVAPAFQIASRELVQKWRNYVKAGGNLILTNRTASRDPSGHLWETLIQKPIYELIGAKIDFFDHLPADEPGVILYKDKEYKWHTWSDILKPDKGTDVLATHKDQYYKGTPAVTKRDLGKGTVTYIGTWTDNHELERKVLRQVYKEEGAKILNLPRYVFTEWRDGYWVTTNYTSDTAKAPVPENTELLFGNKKVGPADVAVWKGDAVTE